MQFCTQYCTYQYLQFCNCKYTNVIVLKAPKYGMPIKFDGTGHFGYFFAQSVAGSK